MTAVVTVAHSNKALSLNWLKRFYVKFACCPVCVWVHPPSVVQRHAFQVTGDSNMALNVR